MADAVYEAYNELDTMLHRVECLLHGAYATAEFWPDKKCEVGLLGLAQDMLGDAQELTTQMYQAHRESIKRVQELRK